MKTRLLVAAAVAIVCATSMTACGGPTPPSCAKPENQQGMSMNAQNKCLDDVQSWCSKNYTNDPACANKVFGTDPRELGDDS